jgi:perosamine synthetase
MSQRTFDERVSIANPDISVAARRNVGNVLAGGHLAEGKEVSAFQSAFAAYTCTARGVATANGTAALHAALHAVGIGEGDTVLTTPFSFVATANAVRFTGATPVFADVDPKTLNLDPDAVEDRLAAGDVDALLVVHLYGLPAAMDELLALAAEYDIPVVEDCAQAHGAIYDGRPVGSLGDVGCFSFYPTKNMTTGEGGMVVTDDESLADRAARFCDHGRTSGYEHVEVGYNYRMTNVAAAIGRAQLERLPAFVRARRRNAARLSEGLADTALELPVVPERSTHAFNQYTVRVGDLDRDRIHERLDQAGIDTRVYYPTPIHRQPAYDESAGSYPVAERAATEVLSLPVHPGLDDEDVDRIVTAVREVTADV